jgi:hypothetical protein
MCVHSYQNDFWLPLCASSKGNIKLNVIILIHMHKRILLPKKLCQWPTFVCKYIDCVQCTYFQATVTVYRICKENRLISAPTYDHWTLIGKRRSLAGRGNLRDMLRRMLRRHHHHSTYIYIWIPSPYLGESREISAGGRTMQQRGGDSSRGPVHCLGFNHIVFKPDLESEAD